MKVVHVKYDTWKFFSIRQNINVYPRVDNNCGDYSGTVLPDNGYLCDTSTPENTDFRSNNMSERTYLVLYSLHIGCTKHIIFSIKTDTTKNITTQKMTEIIESN